MLHVHKIVKFSIFSGFYFNQLLLTQSFALKFVKKWFLSCQDDCSFKPYFNYFTTLFMHCLPTTESLPIS